MFKEWEGFKEGVWQDGIDVRNFIQKNYKLYEGDESFLEGTTEKTDKVWSKAHELILEEIKKGIIDVDTDTVSGIDNYNRHDNNRTYTHVVTKREYLDDGRIKLTSIPFTSYDLPIPDVIDEDNYRSVIWIEGVGATAGIVHNNINYYPGDPTDWLLCAYHNDECRYTIDNPVYAPLGCIYNEGDAINAVENVSPSIPSAQKIIKDGQVLILRNGKTYTMQGQEVK